MIRLKRRSNVPANVLQKTVAQSASLELLKCVRRKASEGRKIGKGLEGRKKGQGLEGRKKGMGLEERLQ